MFLDQPRLRQRPTYDTISYTAIQRMERILCQLIHPIVEYCRVHRQRELGLLVLCTRDLPLPPWMSVVVHPHVTITNV